MATATQGRVSLIDRRSVFVWNVVTFAALGTVICIWADYYTDHLPTIATVLGGGGALAWITTSLGFFREDVRKEFVGWAESAVFARRWFSMTLVSGIVIFGISVTQFGAVQIQSLAEESEHSVQVWRDSPMPEDLARLAPGEHLRRLVFTPLWSKRNVHIKVRGFPERVVEVRPMQRVAVYVPNSVRTPVVLLRPTVKLMDAARPPDGATALFKLEIDTTDPRGKAVQYAAEFDGQHSMLIGGDDEIAIPPQVTEEWRAEADKRIDALRAWRSAVAPEEFAIALLPGQTITLTLRPAHCPPDALGAPAPSKCPPYSGPINYKVRPLHGSQPYIQEVLLDIPADRN